jgi:hypothetical protein
MRTTLNLDDGLIEKARKLTGIQEKTELVHRGLRELVARERPHAGRPRRRVTQGALHSPAEGPGARVILVDTSVWVDHFRRGNAI